MRKLTLLCFAAFLALAFGLMLSCAKKADTSSSTDNTTTTSDNGSSSDNESVTTKWGTAIWSKDV